MKTLMRSILTPTKGGFTLGDLLWDSANSIPSLDLRFADNKSLVDATTGASLVTFTRASSGTFVGSDGVLQTAVTNLVLWSEEFQTTWTSSQLLAFGSGSVTDATTAPNGTLTADRITENTATAQHFVNQSVSGIPASSVITASCYIKFDSANRNFGLHITDAPSGGSGYAELYLTQGGVVTSPTPISFTNRTATVENVGSGWYRVRLTITTAAVTTITTRLFIVSSANAQSYTGDGTSGIYIWGAQLEQSATVGEYIPTTSTINSAPRFDHNPTTGESLGLLVEEARTNLLLRSEAIATSPWFGGANTTLSNNTGEVLDPAGGSTATKVVVSGGTGAFGQGATLTAVVYSGSIWLRCATGTISASLIVYLAGSPFTNIGTTNVTITTSWQRFSVVTSTATAAAYNLQLNTIAAGTVYAWGAQLEVGAFPTSYIPTTTAAATRSADVASITGTAFSSWYRQDEGTFWSHYAAGNNGARPFLASNSDTQERFDQRVLSFRQGSVALAGIITSDYSDTTRTFVAGTAWKHAIAQNGTTLAIGSEVSVTQISISRSPLVDRLWVGSFIGTGTFLNGTIRRLVYWGQRLPNNVLQAITQ